MPLRIVIWNCSMALHSKLEPLMSLNPDIAIIPECATPEIVKKKQPVFYYSDAAWIGLSKHKGLGVFTFSDLSVRVSPSYDPTYELFLPLLITGRYRFDLLAVWSFSYRIKKTNFRRDAPTRSAIEYYRDFIAGGATVVAGDFNDNINWDKPGRSANFDLVIADLKSAGLVSAYHEKGNHLFGSEPDPTLIWRKNPEQSYHIDYCFIPKGWLPGVNGVTVGNPEKWIKYSDHVPLLIELSRKGIRS